MPKTKIILSFLTLLTAAGGTFYALHHDPRDSADRPAPVVYGETMESGQSDPPMVPEGANQGVVHQSALAPAPAAAAASGATALPEPWNMVRWQRLAEPNEVKFKNGDLVIHGNGTLRLDNNAVTAPTIAPKTIQSSHLDTAAINSRTIEDGTITGDDISTDASLTISALTVTGTTTFSGNQIASGNLDMQANLIENIGHSGTDFTSGGGLTLAGTLAVNTDDLYVDTSTGRVGIGTSAPSTELEVVGDIVSAGTKWEAQSSPTDDILWFGVTYGNGLFVAVGWRSGADTSVVMTSPDGINWTVRNAAANNLWWDVTYGNGLFAAVGQNGTNTRVMTSPDGVNWTIRSTPVNNQWKAITYGEGLFVAVSRSGSSTNRVMTSPDGITWTSQTSASGNNWYDVAYGNGTFVATAQSAHPMTSPDGINWTMQTGAATLQWYGVTYGNGLFVAVAQNGTGNRVMTSPDGVTWTSRETPANNQWQKVTYGNGLFVAVAASGTGNQVMTSPDGINWTIRETPADNQWMDVTYGNGMFVAVAQSGTGNRVMTSGKVRHIPLAHDNLYQGGMKINGNVGINMTDPSVALDVTGDIEYTGTLTDVSDERLKENIRIMSGESALSILSQLNAKSYTMVGSDKTEYGFLAQDVQKVFPDAVSVIDPEKGYLGLNYLSFIPLLSESVKTLDSRFTVAARQTDQRLLTLDQKTGEHLLTLASLEASLVEALEVMGERVADLERKDAKHQTRFADFEESAQEYERLFLEQASQGALRETVLATLTEQVSTLSDFYLALELDRMLLADEEGRLELTGELAAPAVKTRVLDITLGDDARPTIGEETLPAGETRLLVETEAVTERSHVLLTPQTPLKGSMAVTEVRKGEGFVVEIYEALPADLSFQWWIVERGKRATDD